MTYWQLLALLIPGPIGLFCVLRMIWSIIFKAANFTLIDAFVLAICTVLIVVSFVGVQW